jgi:hypothetical protein
MAHCFLSLLLVLPEIGSGGLLLKQGDLIFFSGYVKDAPVY